LPGLTDTVCPLPLCGWPAAASAVARNHDDPGDREQGDHSGGYWYAGGLCQHRLAALGLLIFGVYGLCEARWRKA
jgi:hypothetical protein